MLLLLPPPPDGEPLVADIEPVQTEPGLSLGQTNGAEDRPDLLPAQLAAAHVHLKFNVVQCIAVQCKVQSAVQSSAVQLSTVYVQAVCRVQGE